MPQEVRLKTLTKVLTALTSKRKKSTLSLILILLSALAIFIATPRQTTPQYSADYQLLEKAGELLKADFDVTQKAEKATVVSITDGDTIKVERENGDIVPVRYIGIDTPEIKHQGNGTNEKFGQEATALNTWLLREKTVYLQSDAGDTDKYGRLLRYVYLPDGTMVNYAIIRLGYAQILTVQPNVMFQSKLLAAQSRARDEERGLWAK